MITDLRALLVLEAQEMHSAEQQLVEAMPRMLEAVRSASLASGGSLAALAVACGCPRAAELFAETLREERMAAGRLEQIADAEVNARAAAGTEVRR